MSQVVDSDSASEYLHSYDEHMADPARRDFVHRSCHHLCGHGSPCREHLEEYCDGYELRPELAMEIISYQLANLDDTAQEVPHRDVSRIARQGNNSKLPHWCSMVRLQQHLIELDTPDIFQRYVHYWSRWKNIIRIKCRKSRIHWQLKVKASIVIQRVYRLFKYSLEDWDHLKPMLCALLPKEQKAISSFSAKLKIDYLKCELEEDVTYSLPLGKDGKDIPLPRGRSESPSHGTLCTYFEDLAECGSFWVILEKSPMSKRYAMTDQLRAINQNQLLPMLIQKQTPALAGYPLEEHTLETEGVPDVVDQLCISHWSCLRCSLRKWTSTPVENGTGTVKLANSILVCNDDRRWPTRAIEDIPAVVFMEDLFKNGWSLSENKIDVHLKNSPKSFRCSDFVAGKFFMQCLLSLQALCARGLVSLKTGQIQSYYQAILKSKDPSLVKPGLTMYAYRKLMLTADGASALESEHLLQAGNPSLLDLEENGDFFAIQNGVDDEDDDSLRFSVAGDDSLVPVHSRQKRGRAFLGQDEHVSSLFLVDHAKKQAGGRVASTSPSSSSSSGSSGSSSSSSSSHSRSSARRLQAVSPPMPTWQLFKDHNIAGIKIKYDPHLAEGTRGHYKRFVVQCSCQKDLHITPDGKKNCGKRRSISTDNCKHFGSFEALAFVCLWALNSRNFPSKLKHMEYEPSGTDIEAFMREHQMPILTARP